MQQLDLFTPDPPAHDCVTHAVIPNMATACQLDLLEAVAAGCPERHTIYSARDWSEVTCPWCHALGAVWHRWACRIMQGVDPITVERRNTDPERALLAGTEQP